MHTLSGTVTAGGFGYASGNLLPSENLILQRSGLKSLVRGTLNLKLPESYIVPPDFVLVGSEYITGETIKFQRCVVRGLRALIMRPETHERIAGYGHGTDHLELMSAYHLTTVLHLSPGDVVQVEVDGDEAWWRAAR